MYINFCQLCCITSCASQLITKDDGGWYEGKYNGKVGWFPSNYVREIKNPKKSESGQNNKIVTLY